MNVYQATHHFQHHVLHHDHNRRLRELPQVPDRGHETEFEEDQGICRSLPDAGDQLAPVIGYDKASKIAHLTMDNDLTLKAAGASIGLCDGGRIRSRR
jgi:hypothetical protein